MLGHSIAMRTTSRTERPAEAIARHNKAQRVLRERRALELIGEQNRSIGELRRNLAERDHGAVAVRPGHADREMRLFAGIGALDEAGCAEHIPQQRTRPFVLLLATSGRKANALRGSREGRDALHRKQPRGMSGALNQQTALRLRRFDRSEMIGAGHRRGRLRGLCKRRHCCGKKEAQAAGKAVAHGEALPHSGSQHSRVARPAHPPLAIGVIAGQIQRCHHPGATET
jgi:hypothetical protein